MEDLSRSDVSADTKTKFRNRIKNILAGNNKTFSKIAGFGKRTLFKSTHER